MRVILPVHGVTRAGNWWAREAALRHTDYGGGGRSDGIWYQPGRPNLPLEIEASAPQGVEGVASGAWCEKNQSGGHGSIVLLRDSLANVGPM